MAKFTRDPSTPQTQANDKKPKFIPRGLETDEETRGNRKDRRAYVIPEPATTAIVNVYQLWNKNLTGLPGAAKKQDAARKRQFGKQTTPLESDEITLGGTIYSGKTIRKPGQTKSSSTYEGESPSYQKPISEATQPQKNPIQEAESRVGGSSRASSQNLKSQIEKQKRETASARSNLPYNMAVTALAASKVPTTTNVSSMEREDNGGYRRKYDLIDQPDVILSLLEKAKSKNLTGSSIPMIVLKDHKTGKPKTVYVKDSFFAFDRKPKKGQKSKVVRKIAMRKPVKSKMIKRSGGRK